MMKQNKTKGTGGKMLLLAGCFVLVFFGSFMLGRYPVTPLELIRILVNKITPAFSVTWEAAAETVVWQIRLPRVAAAGLIGAALSLSGLSYQGMFSNPMVSPDLLGASSGAGFGASLGILLGLHYMGISALAFCFGLAAVALAYAIGKCSRSNRLMAILLAGMVVSALFSSAISFLKLVADTQQALPAITYWLMGSLSSTRMADVKFLLLPMLLGSVPLFALRWRMNLLTLPEDEARSMGINTRRMQFLVIFCATLLTAASVAVCGMIGWVGLVIPHFARMLFGSDFRRLIPASSLMGAGFLIVVDDVARIAATAEIPLGILTSFIGGPVFLIMMLSRREGYNA